MGQLGLQMGPSQSVQFGALVGPCWGRKKACSSAEFRCVLVAASCVMPLALAGLHQSMKVEFVSITLPMNFGHDVFVIIVPLKDERNVSIYFPVE